MTFRRNAEAMNADLKAIPTPRQYALYEQRKSAMEVKVKKEVVEKHQAAQ